MLCETLTSPMGMIWLTYSCRDVFSLQPFARRPNSQGGVVEDKADPSLLPQVALRGLAVFTSTNVPPLCARRTPAPTYPNGVHQHPRPQHIQYCTHMLCLVGLWRVSPSQEEAPLALSTKVPRRWWTEGGDNGGRGGFIDSSQVRGGFSAE